MAISTQTLEDAIKVWERVVAVEHPLFELDVKTTDPNPKEEHVWQFSTNNEIINAFLFKPDEIDERFENTVLNLYRTAYGSYSKSSKKGLLTKIFGDKANTEDFRKTISFHNSISLLIHELFHPLYMPDSTWTKDDEGKKVPGDKELIQQALARGIKKAMPTTLEADLVSKVRNVENTVWDICIDTFQYYFVSQNKGLVKSLVRELNNSGYTIDEQAVDRFPEGVIPIFDVVSNADSKQMPKSVLTLTRYNYSLLFCDDLETRKNLLDYFGSRIEGGGIKNIESLVKNSLKYLVKEIKPQILKEMRISPKQFVDEVDTIYENRESTDYDNKYLVETMTSLLMDKRTRYQAIEGFIQPLAGLISVENQENRGPGQSGSGSGNGQPQPGQSQGQPQPGQGSGESGNQPSPGQPSEIGDVLNALLDGMTEEEINAFLQALAAGNGSGNNPDLVKLQAQAVDEYYKKNSKEIAIETPDYDIVISVQGKRKIWERDYTLTVPTNHLHKHKRMIDLGQKANLPVLMELIKDQLYAVNYFSEREIDIESPDFQQKGIDVARNWILINDTSGTMGGSSPGCGSRFDGLLHLDYGLLKTLYKAAKQTQKDVDVWNVNYSSSTFLTGPLALNEFYESPNCPEKINLLTSQCGVTNLDTSIFPTIEQQLNDGRTVWTLITDGDFNSSHNAQQVYENIKRITENPDHCFLYFEIFHKSSFGSQLKELMKSRQNVRYRSIDDMDEILNSTLDVLIKYER